MLGAELAETVPEGPQLAAAIGTVGRAGDEGEQGLLWFGEAFGLPRRAAQRVDGAVAQDDDQLGHRRALGRIVVARALPDRHETLLQHVLGTVPLSEHSQGDAK